MGARIPAERTIDQGLDQRHAEYQHAGQAEGSDEEQAQERVAGERAQVRAGEGRDGGRRVHTNLPARNSSTRTRATVQCQSSTLVTTGTTTAAVASGPVRVGPPVPASSRR